MTPTIDPEQLEEDLGIAISNQQDVAQLQYVVRHAPEDRATFKLVLSRVIARKSWLFRYDPNAKQLWREESKAFKAFIVDKQPDGLGTTLDACREMLGGDIALFEEAINEGRGGNRNPEGRNQHPTPPVVNADNVSIDPHPVSRGEIPHVEARDPSRGGNSTAYSTRRLSKDRPDLLERVKAGEITPHRAMVQAGLRKVRTPFEQAQWLYETKLTPEERVAFLEWINQQGA